MRVNLKMSERDSGGIEIVGDVDLTEAELLKLGMILATIHNTGSRPQSPREAVALAKTLLQELKPALKSIQED